MGNCIGYCLSAADICVGGSEIAIGHPSCPEHGDNIYALARKLGATVSPGESIVIHHGDVSAMVEQLTQSNTVNESSEYMIGVASSGVTVKRGSYDDAVNIISQLNNH